MHSDYKPYFLDCDGDCFYVGVHPFFVVFSF